mgnify:CR=1 FL=1
MIKQKNKFKFLEIPDFFIEENNTIDEVYKASLAKVKVFHSTYTMVH